MNGMRKFATPLLFLLGCSLMAPASEPEAPVTDRDRQHWSFCPPLRPKLPEGNSPSPIDRFIEARLAAENLTLAPEADRRSLLRRVTFGLTGLPPTPDETRAFLSDSTPSAYDQVVERLLASPAYGERWAQHWLDVARFAESDGFEFDQERKEAWRYRDWVIRALNEDLPYNLFLQFQLAGDEVEPPDEDAHLATGFLMAGPDMTDINLAAERRHEFLNKMTQNVGVSFLGLTLGCAQCHAHKTDPISIQDFYRFRSFFAATVVDPKKSQQLPPRVQETRPDPPASFVMERGSFLRAGAPVRPAFLRILNPNGEQVSGPPGGATTSYRRSALARWLTRPDHPLTTRVIVNRLWLHHFGRALVATPNDFGRSGEEPSHPALLDWLATELPRRDWSLKSMHRLIVSSRSYRQASRGSGTAWQARIAQDPGNLLFSRASRKRLEGEAIRDSFLAVSGLLNRRTGGPGVRPPLPREITTTIRKKNWVVSPDPSDHVRRSIYLFVRRNLRYPLFDVFDRPDTNASCPQRNKSTTPTQSLTLLNSEFSATIASSLAQRVGADPDPVARLHLLLFARLPTADERSIARELLEGGGLADLALALLNSNEAIYLD